MGIFIPLKMGKIRPLLTIVPAGVQDLVECGAMGYYQVSIQVVVETCSPDPKHLTLEKRDKSGISSAYLIGKDI
jgi:hypothetical protein